MHTKTLFSWMFIAFGIASFWLPDHPKLVNCYIMTMYLIAMFWWARFGLYWDVGYWIAAFAITFVVTFGYLRGGNI